MKMSKISSKLKALSWEIVNDYWYLIHNGFKQVGPLLSIDKR